MPAHHEPDHSSQGGDYHEARTTHACPDVRVDAHSYPLRHRLRGPGDDRCSPTDSAPGTYAAAGSHPAAADCVAYRDAARRTDRVPDRPGLGRLRRTRILDRLSRDVS